MHDNQPWADRLLEQNQQLILERLQRSDYPDPSSWLPADAPPIAQNPMPYGCGHYGCVYPTLGQPGIVVKVTTDSSEARFIRILQELAEKGAEIPEGITRYHGIFRLHGEHREKDVFILWREAAFDVGEVPSRFWLRDMNPNMRGWVMEEGRSVAHEIKRYKQAGDALYFTYQDRRHAGGPARALDYVNDQKEALGIYWKEWDRYSEWDTKFPPDDVDFPLYGAFSLFVMMNAASAMINSGISMALGAALNNLFELGVLPTDVHKGNVGCVDRREEARGDQPWDLFPLAITDPGHVVEFEDFEVVVPYV